MHPRILAYLKKLVSSASSLDANQVVEQNICDQG